MASKEEEEKEDHPGINLAIIFVELSLNIDRRKLEVNTFCLRLAYDNCRKQVVSRICFDRVLLIGSSHKDQVLIVESRLNK